MGNRKRLTIGTRGSKLAMWQANFIADRLRGIGVEEVVIKKIKTTGDKISDVALAKIGGKGLFVKEIEQALLKREVDLAVHSMKDLPTEIPKGLRLGAATERDDPRDALISRDQLSLEELPLGAKIGTSSLRRRAQLKNFRSDFEILDIRGNLDTRIRKMKEGLFDAIVVSSAGVDRMGWPELITERIAPEISLSAVGQGTIAVETRADDEDIAEVVKHVDHRGTRLAVLAERALMKKLEGGCQVPIGAFGEVNGEDLKITANVATLDGKRLIRDEATGKAVEAQAVGVLLAEQLLDRGADEILEEIRKT